MPTNSPSAVDVHSPTTDAALAAAAAGGRPIIAVGHERSLRAELDRLRQRLEVEFADRLRQARGFGSAGDNDDYLQIKEEEAVLAAGIAHISMLLDTALVVDETDLPAGVAALGSTVEVLDRQSGERHRYRLVGGHEPLGPAVASAGSPIGRALMGRRAGEVVDVRLPRSRRRQLEIVTVEAGRERAVL